jgi:hypothetical protein
MELASCMLDVTLLCGPVVVLSSGLAIVPGTVLSCGTFLQHESSATGEGEAAGQAFEGIEEGMSSDENDGELETIGQTVEESANCMELRVGNQTEERAGVGKSLLLERMDKVDIIFRDNDLAHARLLSVCAFQKREQAVTQVTTNTMPGHTMLTLY